MDKKKQEPFGGRGAQGRLRREGDTWANKEWEWALHPPGGGSAERQVTPDIFKDAQETHVTMAWPMKKWQVVQARGGRRPGQAVLSHRLFQTTRKTAFYLEWTEKRYFIILPFAKPERRYFNYYSLWWEFSSQVMSDSLWPHNPPGSSVHGISQARILEWVAISFPGSSQPRDQTQVSCLADSLPVSHLGSPIIPLKSRLLKLWDLSVFCFAMQNSSPWQDTQMKSRGHGWSINSI